VYRHVDLKITCQKTKTPYLSEYYSRQVNNLEVLTLFVIQTLTGAKDLLPFENRQQSVGAFIDGAMLRHNIKFSFVDSEGDAVRICLPQELNYAVATSQSDDADDEKMTKIMAVVTSVDIDLPTPQEDTGANPVQNRIRALASSPSRYPSREETAIARAPTPVFCWTEYLKEGVAHHAVGHKGNYEAPVNSRNGPNPEKLKEAQEVYDAHNFSTSTTSIDLERGSAQRGTTSKGDFISGVQDANEETEQKSNVEEATDESQDDDSSKVGLEDVSDLLASTLDSMTEAIDSMNDAISKHNDDDFVRIVDKFATSSVKDEDASYEELQCAGYDSSSSDETKSITSGSESWATFRHDNLYGFYS